MPNRKIILLIVVAIALIILGREVYFYYFNFNELLKDRIFSLTRPEYINYWLLTYVSFSVLLRILGLTRFLFDNKQGFREYCFGQLMLVALICKEFFRYAFYIYIKQAIETGNWRTLSNFFLLFSIEIGMVVYFYFASLKMSEK